MKKISFVLIILFCATLVFSQQNLKDRKNDKKGPVGKQKEMVVPQAVKDAHSKQFSSITDVRWKIKRGRKEDKGSKNYIAIFKENNLEVRALYNEDGTSVAIIHHLTTEHVPSEIVTKVTGNYPGFTLKSGHKVELLLKNVTYYHLRLNKPSARLSVFVDQNGDEIHTENIGVDNIDEGEIEDEVEKD